MENLSRGRRGVTSTALVVLLSLIVCGLFLVSGVMEKRIVGSRGVTDKKVEPVFPTPLPITETPILTPTPSPPQLNAIVIFGLINDYRVSRGLSGLQWNNDMCPFTNKRLAQTHTDHSHAGFVAEVGKTYCSQCRHAGENLAGDVWSNEELVQGWIHSPTHLDDIVQPDYTVTCVATDTIGEHTFAVQEFASNY